MPNIAQKTYSRLGRRPMLALAAGSAAMAAVVISGGVAIATSTPGSTSAPGKVFYGSGSTGSARPAAASSGSAGKVVAQPGNVASHYGSVAGTPVTLGPNGYASATVTCPVGTEVFGGGESNSAPGVLVLTDSWPTSNTSWLVYVKNNSALTYQFTPFAVCR
jgi:hypothetical protein